LQTPATNIRLLSVITYNFTTKNFVVILFTCYSKRDLFFPSDLPLIAIPQPAKTIVKQITDSFVTSLFAQVLLYYSKLKNLTICYTYSDCIVFSKFSKYQTSFSCKMYTVFDFPLKNRSNKNKNVCFSYSINFFFLFLIFMRKVIKNRINFSYSFSFILLLIRIL
jgi:hypothetical protein